MRAMRMYGPRQPLRAERVAVPRPAPGEALVRVRVAGVCHTELHQLDGVLGQGVVPLTPGHEVVGEIVENRGRGSGPGTRVLLYYYAGCGSCRYCRLGQDNLCPNVSRQLGFSADGGYAEFLVAPADCLVPLPAGLPDQDAVTLGCAAATALHAMRAVAELRGGETVVVYGVGAVGSYLVQLCRDAGARVIAIGRSPDKLALAAELGAEIVDARGEGAAASVQRLTAGDGADVVVDLVASETTMDASVRMLARRGRLVFCGYSEDRLALNPLRLVLREVSLRGAVGCTLSEVREMVELAAAGRLRPIATRPFALEDANLALAELRAGRITGRAVLIPELAPGEPSTRSASPVVGEDVELAPQRAVPPRPAAPQAGPEPAPVAPRPGSRPFEAELLDLIRRGVDHPIDDAEFNALALGLFAYQFERNRPYHDFCARGGRTPRHVAHWTELRPAPIAAFKDAELACEGTSGEACFMSSGTTRPQQRSRHHHPTLDVYDASASTNWAAHLLPDGARLPVLVLNPPRAAAPDSSLAHYLSLMLERYGAAGGGHFVGPQGLETERLLAALREHAAAGRPVAVLGATFAFVHLLDRMTAAGQRVLLPEGSRVMDTGGVKGRSREIGRGELEAAVAERLGVPPGRLVDMYGLTEHSTQFLDSALRAPDVARHKTVPPWARTRVLDPETLRDAPPGMPGLLCHTDLANRASVCTVLTEDMGVLGERGFVLIGRMPGAPARGCSIAIDELLGAR